MSQYLMRVLTINFLFVVFKAWGEIFRLFYYKYLEIKYRPVIFVPNTKVMINIEKTKNLLNIEISKLKPSSCKIVYWNCSKCNIEKQKKFRDANKTNICLSCSNLINANVNKEKRNLAISEYYKVNTHWGKGKKRPQNVIDALRNSDKSYLKTEEYRKKLSERTKGIKNPFYGKKHTEETIEKLKKFQKENARRGKNSNLYGKIHHSKGNWFIDRLGRKFWMRSSWEIKYARFLDENLINWDFEHKAYKMIINNTESTYTPDFYLIDSNEYIEIKGYWRDDAKVKFEKFKEEYPNLKITLYKKADLKNLGIKL